MKPVVKGFIVCAVIAGGLFVLWQRYSDFLAQGQKPPESTQILNQLESHGVPNFELKDLSGQPISLEQFRGKIVLVNFWASWCEPCVHEFPSMMKLVETMKGELILLAISADYTEADIAPFLKAFKVDSPWVHVMWDKDQEVAKKLGTFKLPESYVVGVDGSLVRKVAGVEDWATPDALAFFRDLAASASVNGEKEKK